MDASQTLDDDGNMGIDTSLLADQGRLKEKSKYRYTEQIFSPKSNCVWFKCLAYKHLSLTSGTSMSTGYTLEAFGFFDAGKKTHNVVLVSKPGEATTLANISWLGLDAEGVDLTAPKPRRYGYCIFV